MPRRRSDPSISFFAFQDVITAVTGIVIAVVLLLALELTSRTFAERPTTDSEPTPQDALADLREDVQQAKAEVEQLQRQIADWAELLNSTEVTDATALRARLDELRDKNQSLRSRAEYLRQSLRERARRLAGARIANSLEQRKLAAELARAEARLDALERNNRELEQQIEDIRTAKRIFYRMPRGDVHTGWIGVVRRGTVELAPIGEAARPVTLSADAVADFIANRSNREPYVFLLVKPSGIETFHLFRSLLRKGGIAYGYDVIGDDQIALDPETGAVGP